MIFNYFISDYIIDRSPISFRSQLTTIIFIIIFVFIVEIIIKGKNWFIVADIKKIDIFLPSLSSSEESIFFDIEFIGIFTNFQLFFNSKRVI
jgi:hypothetical protein